LEQSPLVPGPKKSFGTVAADFFLKKKFLESSPLVLRSKKSFWSNRRRFQVQKKVFGVAAAGSAFKKKFLRQSGPVERSKKKKFGLSALCDTLQTDFRGDDRCRNLRILIVNLAPDDRPDQRVSLYLPTFSCISTYLKLTC